MKKVAQFIAVSLSAVGALLTLRTFRRYHHEMDATRQRVHAGSAILQTGRGVIEYAVKGEGVPALALHGAGGGYDQGLLLGRMAPEGLKLISVSRFGYLRSPIPENSSVEAQAALYAALLEHLEIESVMVLGGSAGGPSALQFAHDYPERCSALILVSAISMPMGPDRDTFQNKAIHTIQKSDFLYWLLTKSFQSQFLELIGVPPAVYRALTLEQKRLVQEMLDVMHPMSARRAGSIHEFEITPLDPVQ